MSQHGQDSWAASERTGISCPPSGVEWVVEAVGCEAMRLADLSLVRAVCENVVQRLELRVIGQPQWHQFPGPAGVTGLYLLSESHLACHTFPEHGLATFNLYCCRRRSSLDWERLLTEQLGATEVRVREMPRGLTPPARQEAGR